MTAMPDEPKPVPLLDEAEVDELLDLIAKALGPPPELPKLRLVVDNDWDLELLESFNKHNG